MISKAQIEGAINLYVWQQKNGKLAGVDLAADLILDALRLVISPPTAADAMSAPDTKPQSPQTGEEAER